METPPFRKRRLPAAASNQRRGQSATRNASWKTRADNQKVLETLDVDLQYVLKDEDQLAEFIAESRLGAYLLLACAAACLCVRVRPPSRFVPHAVCYLLAWTQYGARSSPRARLWREFHVVVFLPTRDPVPPAHCTSANALPFYFFSSAEQGRGRFVDGYANQHRGRHVDAFRAERRREFCRGQPVTWDENLAKSSAFRAARLRGTGPLRPLSNAVRSAAS
jgi:hypothetical protein